MEAKNRFHNNLPKFNDNSYAHFVTTKTYKNYPYFKDERLCLIVLEELEYYRDKLGFELMGYVIMPDHVHILLWWDRDDKPEVNVSKIMQNIKGASARKIIDLICDKGLEQTLQATQTCKNYESHKRCLKYRLWQPGFYDFNIYTEDKLIEKLDYMQNNPVSAGLVPHPDKYKWTSFKRYSEGSQVTSWRKRPAYAETC